MCWAQSQELFGEMRNKPWICKVGTLATTLKYFLHSK